MNTTPVCKIFGDLLLGVILAVFEGADSKNEYILRKSSSLAAT